MTETLTRTHGSHISINLATRRLSYFEGNSLINKFPVGVGKLSTPTPTGSYSIIEMIMHPGGALGTRWMGLSIPGGRYGIHGTNNPSSIGGYVSNGCVRMYNQDVEALFPNIKIGTPVKIFSSAGGSNPGHVQNSQNGGKQKIHIVLPGESLWQIAIKYGKDLNAIIQANNITDPDVIFPGQLIIVPD